MTTPNEYQRIFGITFAQLIPKEFIRKHLRINLNSDNFKFDKELIRTLFLYEQHLNNMLTKNFWDNILDDLDCKFLLNNQLISKRFQSKQLAEYFFNEIHLNYSKFKVNKHFVKKIEKIIDDLMKSYNISEINDYLNSNEFISNEEMNEIDVDSSNSDNSSDYEEIQSVNQQQQSAETEDQPSLPHAEQSVPEQPQEKSAVNVTNDNDTNNVNNEDDSSDSERSLIIDSQQDNNVCDENNENIDSDSDNGTPVISESIENQIEKLKDKPVENLKEKPMGNVPKPINCSTPAPKRLNESNDNNKNNENNPVNTDSDTEIEDNNQEDLGNDSHNTLNERFSNIIRREKQRIQRRNIVKHKKIRLNNQRKDDTSFAADDDDNDSMTFSDIDINETNTNKNKKNRKSKNYIYDSSSQNNDDDDNDNGYSVPNDLHLIRKELFSNLPKSYTEDEDLRIIKFIVKENRYREIKGRVLWEDMEIRKVCPRTWQSMKERFRRTIVPKIHFYQKLFQLSDDVVSNIEFYSYSNQLSRINKY